MIFSVQESLLTLCDINKIRDEAIGQDTTSKFLLKRVQECRTDVVVAQDLSDAPEAPIQQIYFSSDSQGIARELIKSPFEVTTCCSLLEAKREA